MRLVLDTNVIIAAIVADGLCRNIVRRRIQGHDLFTSAELVEELAEKLRTKFKQDPADVPIFGAYQHRATLVEPIPLPKATNRDADDDVVLATAVAAKADVILTGDMDLLVLSEYEGIKILSPRQFLEMLDQNGEGS